MEVRGEVLYLHSITRSEMGSYMCVAKNGVPPAVSKIVQLNVNCKYSHFIVYQCMAKPIHSLPMYCTVYMYLPAFL